MKILAGVVLYDPPASTIYLLQDLKAQGCELCIVNNGMHVDQDVDSFVALVDYFLDPSENIGLASGLNAIICKFAAGTFRYLFLFDQDSQVDKTFVNNMIIEYQNIASVDKSIVCLAPRIVDIKRPPSSLIAKLGNVIKSKKMLFLAAVTSGSLFIQASFSRVGLMDDRLFMDGIDHDWFLRAWQNNWSIYFSLEISLLHSVGDTFLEYRGSFKPLHDSPLRHYYIVRNSIFLILWKKLPLRWKLREIFKTFRRILAYPLLGSNHFLSLQMVLLGIFDGFLCKMGKASG